MKRFDEKDIEQLKAALCTYSCHDYNSNINAWIMWNHVYELYTETHENYTLMLMICEGEPSWLMPLCAVEYRQEAMAAMMDYSNRHGFKFLLTTATDEFKRWCQKMGYPFVYQRERGRDDYVYELAMHRDLTGKKMQKRRNHYNAFLKEHAHDAVYETLKPSQFEEIDGFLEEWKNHHSHLQDIENEIIGIHRLFDQFEALKLCGGIIRINGKIEALLIASPIDEEMLEIHVEKVNHEIRGLSVAILKDFLTNVPKQYTKIDREEDLDLPELRKAKLDMHPLYRIKRFAMMPGEVKEQLADAKLLPQLQQLWVNSFPDETQASADFYFAHLYDPNLTYCLLHEEQLVGMLHLRPLTLSVHRQAVPALLIVGIAIDPSYQECGYMRVLLDRVIEERKDQILLIQAYDWELYKSFGFKESHHRRKTILRKMAYDGLPKQCDLCNDAQILLDLYNAYVQNKDGYRVRSLAYYTEYLIPYARLSGQVLIHRGEDGIDGYLVFEDTEKQRIVTELISHNQKAANAMMSCICDTEKEIEVIHFDEEIVGDSIDEPAMMSLNLPYSEENFISECL